MDPGFREGLAPVSMVISGNSIRGVWNSIIFSLPLELHEQNFQNSMTELNS